MPRRCLTGTTVHQHPLPCGLLSLSWSPRASWSTVRPGRHAPIAPSNENLGLAGHVSAILVAKRGVMSDPIVPLAKTSYMVAELLIVDEDGNAVTGSYTLRDGGNSFSCVAVYIDGTRGPFRAYWTCPVFLRDARSNLWSVLGKDRRESVIIHASSGHERYAELACWAFAPDSKPPTDGPRMGIALDYSNFDQETK